MSFSAIRSIATSALTSTQVRMQVTSSNIANADVDGYTKKTATQAATTSSGAGTGTVVTAIKSDVDKFLLRDVIAAASELGAANAANTKLDALQSQMGSTTSSDDSGTSISDTISTLLTSLTSLSGTVESDTLQGLAVESLDAVATQLRETSATVQDLRAQTDEGIADAVDIANEALQTISDLNEQIVSAKALGQTTADLEDKRNTALESLATAARCLLHRPLQWRDAGFDDVGNDAGRRQRAQAELQPGGRGGLGHGVLRRYRRRQGYQLGD